MEQWIGMVRKDEKFMPSEVHRLLASWLLNPCKCNQVVQMSFPTAQ